MTRSAPQGRGIMWRWGDCMCHANLVDEIWTLEVWPHMWTWNWVVMIYLDYALCKWAKEYLASCQVVLVHCISVKLGFTVYSLHISPMNTWLFCLQRLAQTADAHNWTISFCILSCWNTWILISYPGTSCRYKISWPEAYLNTTYSSLLDEKVVKLFDQVTKCSRWDCGNLTHVWFTGNHGGFSNSHYIF